MNPLKLFLPAFVLAASSLLYANPREVSPVPVGDQEVIYSQGTPFVFSRGEMTALQVSLEGDDSRSFWLTLNFSNLGDERALVDANRIFPRAFKASGEVKAELISAAELERREKRRQIWEEIGAGVAAGLNDYNASQAGYGTATATHQGRIRGYGSRSGAVSGTYTGTSRATFRDPVAAQLAREQARSENERMFNSLKEDQQLRESALAASVLKSHTVSPGETHSGRLQIELPRRQRGSGVLLSLDVEFAGETHPFLFVIDGAVDSAFLRAKSDEAAMKLARLQTESRVFRGEADSRQVTSDDPKQEEPKIAVPQSRLVPVGSPSINSAQLASKAAAGDNEAMISPISSEDSGDSDFSGSSASPSLSGTGGIRVRRERPLPSEFSQVFADIRVPAGPIVLSLHDARFDRSLLFKLSVLEQGVEEAMASVESSTRIEQKRREDEVEHVASALSFSATDGARRIQSFVMPEGFLMRSFTSPSGALIRAAELVDAQGNVQVSASTATGSSASMEFTKGPVGVGEVAATSPPTPFAARISSVSGPTQWLLEGEIEHDGRQALLLSASTMVRTVIPSGRRGIQANHSFEGYCIVDKETGVVLDQVEILRVSPIEARRDQYVAQVRTQIRATLQGSGR